VRSDGVMNAIAALPIRLMWRRFVSNRSQFWRPIVTGSAFPLHWNSRPDLAGLHLASKPVLGRTRHSAGRWIANYGKRV
jgi:hypothetical protein